MADEKKIEPMTDACIESIVQLVQNGEIMASAFNLSASEGTRMLLKSMQIIQRMNTHDPTALLSAITSATQSTH